jgi:hypothetical protein
MKNLRPLNLLAIAALFLLNSCSFIIKSYIKKDMENIPADFGKEKTTLLIIQERKGYNKKVEKIVKKNYSGEYIFVTKQELDAKYANTERYRYVLDDEISVSSTKVVTTTISPSVGVSSRSSEVRSAASRSFRILDRKANKLHDTGVSSGTSWKTILKTYLQKLDAERKKNGGN